MVIGIILAGLLVFGGVTAYNELVENKMSMGDNMMSGTKITVYNQGLGLVKQDFSKTLPSGTSHLLIEDVASLIDTSSVKLSSKNNEVELLEQNYQYDLVDQYQLMQKFVGKQVTVLLKDPREEMSGRLLSYSGSQAIIESDDGSIRILESGEYVLPSMNTSELLLKPTLDWLVDTPVAKQYDMSLMYLTQGMSWNADYIMVLNEADTEGDFKGWVTVNNNAGTTFKNAELKLMAGDINIVQEPSPMLYERMYDVMATGAEEGKGFVEEGMFEYHMYTLQRPTTLRNNEQKQISLLEAKPVGVSKRFVYSGGDKVLVKVAFNNSEANKMGMPLPKGKVKVFKEDSSKSLQFLGEDRIDHTPKDEELDLSIGNAFDITGEKSQTNYQTTSSYNMYSYEVTLRNHKDEDVIVHVEESPSGYREWDMISENFPHEKEAQNKIVWKIPVPKDGEVKLTYTIRYKVYR